jgi:hypothetical protein
MPGSKRMPTALVESFHVVGPGFHHDPISWVKTSKAVARSTLTSTLAVTVGYVAMA